MPLKRIIILLPFWLITLFCGKAQSESRLPDKEVHLPSLTLTVSELLLLLQQDGIVISYSNSYLRPAQTLHFKTNRMTVRELLSSFLGSDRIQYLPDKVLLLPPPRRIVSGYVYDQRNGEALIGAILYDPEGKVTGITNEYGFFQVSLARKITSLTASYIGYSPDTLQIVSRGPFRIFLRQHEVKLSETTVFPKHISEPLASTVIDMNQAGYMPSLLGGDDIISRLQDASGVSSQNLFQPLSVRTDRSDNNLVMLDGIPVYSYMHMFSMFSIFNSNAIQKATLYKGLYPSKYEGRLGAVLDIRMKDGNKKHYEGLVSMDMATVSAMIEGPIVKDKSSFMVSARRSWLDALQLFPVSNEDRLSFSAFDIYLKANLRSDDRNQFYLSNYAGGDLYELGSSGTGEQTFVRWNNFLAALRWNHIFSDTWFVDSSVSYSHYQNKTNPFGVQVCPDALAGNEVVTLALNSDFVNTLNERMKMNFGYRVEFSEFATPVLNELSGYQTELSTQMHQNLKASLYYEMETEIGSHWNLRSGLNAIAYLYQNTPYHQFQPRVQLGYRVGKVASLFAGYSRMGQFYHQITMPLVSAPFELRIPSSARVRPSSSDLYEVGIKSSPSAGLTLSASVFYKYTSGLIAYRPGQDPSGDNIAPLPSDRIVQGTGAGWGTELETAFMTNKWKINMAYIFSDSRENYPGMPEEQYSRMQTTIPHQLKTTFGWFMSKHSTLTTRLSFTSGMWLNYPVYTLPSVESVMSDNAGSASYYTGNAAQQHLPDSWQWDVGYALTLPGFGEHNLISLRVGINNILGTNRVYSYAPVIENGRVRLDINSLANLIPYLGLTYKF